MVRVNGPYAQPSDDVRTTGLPIGYPKSPLSGLADGLALAPSTARPSTHR